MTALVVTRATHADADALTELFSAADVRCHCRYWHFEGDKNDWLDRNANAPDVNRDELVRGLERRADDAIGLVARAAAADSSTDEPILGWLKLAPGAATPKLFEQRYYRSLPIFTGDRAELVIIACLLVRPEARHRGVARALVEGAVAHAGEVAPTARFLVALPRVTPEPVADGELWLGPRAIFDGLGFEEVHTEPPYPVLRRPILRSAR